MKVSFLPFFATSLPLLLVQHATQVNAAALCIPGLNCQQASTAALAPAPACTTADGHPPSPPSSSGGSGNPATTYHSTITVTVTASLPLFTSTATGPAGGPAGGPSSSATATGLGEGIPTTVTGAGPVGGASSTAASDPTYVPGGSSSPVGGTSAGGNPPAPTTVTVSGAPQPTTTTGGSCNSGPVQCCDSVQPSSSKNASNLLGLLGIVLQGDDVPIGINCNPISVIGAGSAGTCNAQTVCCENNNFSGLVNIGCTPINIGL